MNIRKQNILTAILIMAVMFIGYFSSGCVTPRHIDELKAEIRSIKADNEQTREMVGKMDSLITSSTESNNKLRHDVTYSSDQMQERIDQLLENYNELLAVLQQINQNLTTRSVIQSSPGIQTDRTTTPTETTQTQKPSVDCGESYDVAFTHTLHEEYQEAINKFKKFIEDCPEHENVSNARYWTGESYYLLNKYVEAADEFQYLIDNFKSSQNVSRALYQIARCKQELGKNNEAKALYQKVIDDYPETFEARQASERLKDL